MKRKIDWRYFKVCIYAFCTIAALVLFVRVLSSFDNIVQSVHGAVSSFLAIISPFIIGFVVAYLFNPVMKALESRIFPKALDHKSRRRARTIALAIIYVVLIGAVAVTLIFTVPVVIKNVSDLVAVIPQYIDEAKTFLETEVVQSEFIKNAGLDQSMEQELGNQIGVVGVWIQSFFSNLVGGAINVAQFIFKLVIGFTISAYMLVSKERIAKGLKRLVIAVLGRRRGENLINFFRDSDVIFGNFIRGRLLDSLIIGILAIAAFWILGLPYGFLMGVIVGITNIVPYFGPFIGAVPPIVVALFESPGKAIAVGIVILVIQQLDGAVIGPKTMSNKMGISAFWVMIGVVVGGGLFGFVGMFIGVPLAAIFKLLMNRFIDNRLAGPEDMDK